MTAALMLGRHRGDLRPRPASRPAAFLSSATIRRSGHWPYKTGIRHIGAALTANKQSSPHHENCYGRQPIAAGDAQQRRVQFGVSAKPAVKIIAQVVIAVEFIEKLKNETRAQVADALDLSPPS
jgi:hypothetical protein